MEPFDTLILRAALAGVGIALVAAPLGCFIVWRRMAYFGETVAHSGLLGVALGLFLSMDPAIGVIAVALALAALLVLLQRQRALPADTILGILAHASLAGGLVAAGLLTGSQVDLMAYLFGDILAVSSADLVWIYAGGACIVAGIMVIWRALLATAIHEELAAAEGVGTVRANAVLMLLLAVTVALAMKLVGILLIASLLIMPAAAARPFVSTPEQMAVLAAGVAAIAVLAGLGLALWLDWPAGPSIVLALAGIVAASLTRALGTSSA